MTHHVSLRRGTYHDSVTLLRLSQLTAETAGVTAVQVAMATPLNVELAQGLGFDVPADAGPNDLLIAVQGVDDDAVQTALLAVEAALSTRSGPPLPGVPGAAVEPRTVRAAAAARPDAALVLLSVPGPSVLGEALDAIAAGRHLMIFSDNVPVTDEVVIKQAAAEANVLVMGPDCGTAVIGGVGLGFANVLRTNHSGPQVGVVAASGTGAQQLTCLLDDAGVGVSQVLGVGGRDLSAAVGGRSAEVALRMLDADPATDHIVLLSKPPDPGIAAAIEAIADSLATPVSTIMIGIGQPDITAGAKRVLADLGLPAPAWLNWHPDNDATHPGPGALRGLYAGGTLADEAMVVARAVLGDIRSNIPLRPDLALPSGATRHGRPVLAGFGHVVVDLGDDEFTAGRPHPMIDPTLRLDLLAEQTTDPDVAVLLLDVVLGHAADPDPAGRLAPAICAAIDTARADGRTVSVVIALCGTSGDPQDRQQQAGALVAAGADVYASNAEAARAAAALAAGLGGVTAQVPGLAGAGTATAGAGSDPAGGSGSDPAGGPDSDPAGGSGDDAAGGTGSGPRLISGSGNEATRAAEPGSDPAGGSGSDPAGGSGSDPAGGAGRDAAGGSGDDADGASGSGPRLISGAGNEATRAAEPGTDRAKINGPAADARSELPPADPSPAPQTLPAAAGHRPVPVLPTEPLAVICAGIDLLAEALRMQAVDVLTVDFRPAALDAAVLETAHPATVPDALRAVLADPRRSAANALAAQRMLAVRAQLIDVRPAGAALGMQPGEFCHAGPPIEFGRASGPLRGALIGAMIFEGLADDETEAIEKLLAGDGISLTPCHDRHAVGPMAGVISPSMWLFELSDEATGARSWCSLNEGLGKVLRYGAYSAEVITRLRWMADVLGPALGIAVRAAGPIDITAIIGQMVQMGDEGHNRNRAGTLMFLREILPALIASGLPADDIAEVARFVAGNDHFFLNLVMPAGKLMGDAAADIPGSTIVTAMCRNGTDFGIRVSGTGNEWFTGPALYPDGLFLAGFGPDDANPDIGDSAIAETMGIGGMVMATAPAIVRFVGGSVPDALAVTARMYEITEAENPAFAVPILEFRGAPTGIDVTRVLRTGILPQINTGMAGRIAGTGQVGAGLVTPPMDCFTAAVTGLAARVPAG